MSKKSKQIIIDREKPFFGLPEKTVSECLNAHFYGLGMLYALITDRDILYDTQRNCYYVWAGHHYKPDYLFNADGRVEDVCCCLGDYYLSLGRQIADTSDDGLKKSLGKRQDQITKYIRALRSPAGIKQCLEMARTNPTINISVTSDEFDQDPWLLAGPNGVMDLALGERRPGRKSDMCLKHTHVKIPESVLEEKAPTWENFLAESIGDGKVIEFIQRWCGYVLVGLVIEHIVLILSGLLGRNGKTVLIETLKKILGEYAISIQAEMLLDQGRTRSSAGPSPDIMSLEGVRLAVASESDENHRFSGARLKLFSGGDTLVGRNPHDKHQRQFKPSHKLCLITNNDPHAPADDHAFWARILKVDFPFTFKSNPDPAKKSEKPMDPKLTEKLNAELPGIMAWMVRGNIMWQREGLQPPPQVKESVEQYRRNEDTIQDYLDERCITTDDPDQAREMYEIATALYEDFSSWWEKYHSKRIPSIQWFGRRMSKKFKKEKRAGSYVYYGVQLMSS